MMLDFYSKHTNTESFILKNLTKVQNQLEFVKNNIPLDVIDSLTYLHALPIDIKSKPKARIKFIFIIKSLLYKYMHLFSFKEILTLAKIVNIVQ